MTLLVNVDVPSLAEAQRFYAGAFGLRPGRRIGDDVLEMQGWPVSLYLLQKPAGTTGAAGQPRRYERHWTPVHLDVVVADIGQAVARAERFGAIVEQAPAQVAFGRIAILADPFGHGFCLIEFSEAGYDAPASTT